MSAPVVEAGVSLSRDIRRQCLLLAVGADTTWNIRETSSAFVEFVSAGPDPAERLACLQIAFGVGCDAVPALIDRAAAYLRFINGEGWRDA